MLLFGLKHILFKKMHSVFIVSFPLRAFILKKIIFPKSEFYKTSGYMHTQQIHCVEFI